MKPLFLLLLMPAFSFAQKIESNSFDKFDSVYSVKSSKEILQVPMFKYQGLWVRVSKFNIVKYDDTMTLMTISFMTKNVTSTDKDSYMKIQFSDGIVKDYKNKNESYKIYSDNDIASIVFEVNPGDDLYTKDVSSIRISTSRTTQDYEIKSKKSDVIRNTLNLIATIGFKK